MARQLKGSDSIRVLAISYNYFYSDPGVVYSKYIVHIYAYHGGHIIELSNYSGKSANLQWNKNLWDFSSSGEERYWESQTEGLKCFLHNSKVVKIHGFAKYANDISLVKFLLKNGKVLQKLFLCTSLSKPRDSIFREKIRSQIMGFSRASPSAKIVLESTLNFLRGLLKEEFHAIQGLKTKQKTENDKILTRKLVNSSLKRWKPFSGEIVRNKNSQTYNQLIDLIKGEIQTEETIKNRKKHKEEIGMMAQDGAKGVFFRQNNQGRQTGPRNQGYKAEVNEVTHMRNKTISEVSAPQPQSKFYRIH
ncbi:putative F-box/FBD/LRR-repeat protein [Forsythia ovata]|uniref:F-box/FBD/LRR-repeat protein n=1 Tax=Forsythia ovata TaxID=205694 RepID=A0ABD1WJ89_9LAMI